MCPLLVGRTNHCRAREGKGISTGLAGHVASLVALLTFLPPHANACLLPSCGSLVAHRTVLGSDARPAAGRHAMTGPQAEGGGKSIFRTRKSIGELCELSASRTRIVSPFRAGHRPFEYWPRSAGDGIAGQRSAYALQAGADAGLRHNALGAQDKLPGSSDRDPSRAFVCV